MRYLKLMPHTNKEPLVDIGANLTNSAFKHDFDEVIDRAQAVNVAKIIITGTDLTSSEHAARLAQQHPEKLFSTAGIHPHDAKHYSREAHTELLSLAKLPQVKAIGETGLDFNRNYSPPEQQIKAFEQQLELAIETGLPLFLHERDAHKKQWDILHNHRDQLSRAVIHCFTGSKQEAFNYLDLDLHLGITGWICDERRGYHLHEFIGDIPLNRLMIETDAPYLTPRVKPKPTLKSSRRNEPCTLPYVLAAVATHRQQPIELIARATTDNATEFFGLLETEKTP
jgi:TatD DNase family protein